MEDRAAQQKLEDLIPIDELERRWEEDILKMTLGGVKPHLMHRLIAEGIKPRKLGRQGIRKVRSCECQQAGLFCVRGAWLLAVFFSVELIRPRHTGGAGICY